jgi:predicted nucleic acid-binding protein
LILVDSSVWIDYFNGTITPQTDKLDELLVSEPLAIGDLILTEVLQGFNDESDFKRAKSLLTALTMIDLAGHQIAVKAAAHDRKLRKMGIPGRKTIDSIIATRCVEEDYQLLHSDRDFEPFVKHLGLREA